MTQFRSFRGFLNAKLVGSSTNEIAVLNDYTEAVAILNRAGNPGGCLVGVMQR
jgi:hypothetical protein